MACTSRSHGKIPAADTRTLRFKYIPPIGFRRVSARGTLLDLIQAIPYLSAGNLIPPLRVLNDVLRRGRRDAGMSGGAIWRPFSIKRDEYDELVGKWRERKPQLEVPTDVPRGIRTHKAFFDWVFPPDKQTRDAIALERRLKRCKALSRRPPTKREITARRAHWAHEESDPVTRAIWLNDYRSLKRTLLIRPKKLRTARALDVYIWHAAKEGRARLVRLLIEHGARTTIICPIATSHERLPLLSTSMILEYEPVVRVLLAAGADPNGGKKDYGVPLREALSRGLGRAARRLLEAGADPNAGHRHRLPAIRGWTPFLCAVAPSHSLDGEKKIISTLRMLLDYGARPDVVTADGPTALSIAQTYELRKVAAFLRRAIRSATKTAAQRPYHLAPRSGER